MHNQVFPVFPDETRRYKLTVVWDCVTDTHEQLPNIDGTKPEIEILQSSLGKGLQKLGGHGGFRVRTLMLHIKQKNFESEVCGNQKLRVCTKGRNIW